MAYSKQLEDENLFKIRLVQEDEMNLEKMRVKMKVSINAIHDQIEQITRNIEIGKGKLDDQEAKLNYFTDSRANKE